MADPTPDDPEFARTAPPKPPALPGDPAGRAFAWLRGHERGVIVAAVAFQLLILAAMVASLALPTFGAPTVYLRVVPVDPRDLMRGDYVTLGYAISRLPPGGVQGLPGPQDPHTWQSRTVYVELLPEPDGRHYRGGAVSTDPPRTGRFIRGTLNGRNGITFGIESYFVQEGKGHDYERAIIGRGLSAEVALAPSGQAALRRLVFD